MKRLRIPVLALALALASCAPDFNKASIDQLEREIRDQLSTKGMEIHEVRLLKTGKGKVTGFVKGRQLVEGVGRFDVVLNCEATMAQDSANYVWSCRP